MAATGGNCFGNLTEMGAGEGTLKVAMAANPAPQAAPIAPARKMGFQGFDAKPFFQTIQSAPAITPADGAATQTVERQL